MKNLKIFLSSVVFLFVLALYANGQNVISLDDNDLSFEEKMAIGKAYIDETFPDCDFDYLYPHSIFKKDIQGNNEKLTKDTWIKIYPWEYKLYLYYNNKLNEMSLSPKEIELRKQNDKKDHLEKEKYLETKKNLPL